jgi:hypothetical protein
LKEQEVQFHFAACVGRVPQCPHLMNSVEFRELHTAQDQDCFFELRGTDAVDSVPVFADVEVNVMGTLGLFAARVDQVTCGSVLDVFGRFVKHMSHTFSFSIVVGESAAWASPRLGRWGQFVLRDPVSTFGLPCKFPPSVF